ncbi:MAG: hypothetical protein HQ513_02925 [Rhodospirillales bacterium]|nr:hypothetical protein [Rhodospirillales bacterium]
MPEDKENAKVQLEKAKAELEKAISRLDADEVEDDVELKTMVASSRQMLDINGVCG